MIFVVLVVVVVVVILTSPTIGGNAPPANVLHMTKSIGWLCTN